MWSALWSLPWYVLGALGAVYCWLTSMGWKLFVRPRQRPFKRTK